MMLDHLSIQVDDLDRATAFYDVVLAPLGYRRTLEREGVVAYGDGMKPEFFVGVASDAQPGRESHIAFTAPDRAAVDAFVAAAVGVGAEVLHEARVWPEYHAGYYGGFVRDPDGNNVEAVHHTF